MAHHGPVAHPRDLGPHHPPPLPHHVSHGMTLTYLYLNIESIQQLKSFLKHTLLLYRPLNKQ